VYVSRDRGSVLRQQQCKCTSGFVDDVMFSHNGANGPESKTTRMCYPVRQVAVPWAKYPTVSLNSRCRSHQVSIGYLSII